jgi:hypothetical protein
LASVVVSAKVGHYLDMRFDFPSLVDWFTVVSAIGTAVAAILALVAIVTSKNQARRNAQMIIHERHNALQLELLTDLLDLLNGAYLQPSASSKSSASKMRWRAIHARLRILESALPTVRARYAKYETNRELFAAVGISRATPSDLNGQFIDGTRVRLRDRMFDEVVDAIAELAKQSAHSA